MTDREALAAALEHFTVNRHTGPFRLVGVAARERLDQLPEKCGNCTGSGYVQRWGSTPDPCPSCHGSGKVYPAELVGRVVKAIDDYWESAARRESGVKLHIENLAVAVLDALNGEPE